MAKGKCCGAESFVSFVRRTLEENRPPTSDDDDGSCFFLFYLADKSQSFPPFHLLSLAYLGHLAFVYLSLPVLLFIKKVNRAEPIPMDRHEEGFLMFTLFFLLVSYLLCLFVPVYRSVIKPCPGERRWR
jgi:hypothetical protein